MRVLIVEDQEDLAEAIAGRLQKCGYAVDITSDGSEVDEQLRRENYHLIVLDLILPGLHGKAILQQLRRRRSMTPVHDAGPGVDRPLGGRGQGQPS